MKKMKRFALIGLVLLLALTAAVLAGCGEDKGGERGRKRGGVGDSTCQLECSKENGS